MEWQPPPAADQDGFGYNYGVSLHRYRMKRAMLRWWAAQATLATPNLSATGARIVSVVPAGLNLDTVHNLQHDGVVMSLSRGQPSAVAAQLAEVCGQALGYAQPMVVKPW